MNLRHFLKKERSDLILVALFILFSLLLLRLELFKRPAPVQGQKARAEVLAVDNSGVNNHGFIRLGFQSVKLRVMDGKFAGKEFDAHNTLQGRSDLDKMFGVGDIALAAISLDGDEKVVDVRAQDHYRLNKMLWLFLLFALLLLGFCGWTGVKALLSFVLACLVIWKLVIPLCLHGYNPIFTALAAVVLLCFVIIFSIAGFSTKGTSAFLGSLLGISASCVLAVVATHLMKIDGAVMPYSLPLYYAGFEYLNLTDIYIACIYLASSGAMMDLAMDVAAGMKELIDHRPDISRRKLMLAGFRIGRMVVGTMTTTLLLAYSGGYLTMIMTFTAEGVSIGDFLNCSYVAAEVTRTLVGSIGLVLVAPFTALVAALILRPDPATSLLDGDDAVI